MYCDFCGEEAVLLQGFGPGEEDVMGACAACAAPAPRVAHEDVCGGEECWNSGCPGFLGED